jgi:flavin reductase (DIM6/NTAB) family NADH-FMN oxidoreductase RutF
MTQVLIPRPIAWILSINENESFNLAPFSYFSGVCSEPPLISISIGKKKNGMPKDTRQNILDRKSFVVHIPNIEQAQMVTDSAKPFESGNSEIENLDLEIQRIEGFKLPILKDAAIALECEYHQHFEVGDVQQALILGRIQKLYTSEGVSSEENGRRAFCAKSINPLARLGGKDYAGLDQSFTIEPSP